MRSMHIQGMMQQLCLLLQKPGDYGGCLLEYLWLVRETVLM